jgi:hypothetical protein
MLGEVGWWLLALYRASTLPALGCSHQRRRARWVALGFALGLPAHGGAPRRLMGSALSVSATELARCAS